MLNADEEDEQIWKGYLTYVPNIDDGVTLDSGIVDPDNPDNTILGTWVVTGRTFLIMKKSQSPIAILLLEPVGGAWDGSTDRYLDLENESENG